MKSKIIAILISAAISAALLSGIDQLHLFAFYVSAVMNVLGWLVLVAGGVKKAAEKTKKYWWMGIPTTALSLYALIFTSHPMLAASSFILSVIVIAVVHGNQKVAA
jgi:hypothetical protein